LFLRAPGGRRALAYDRAVSGFLRRDREQLTSVEDEREALRRQRTAAAEELERMKLELAERVAAVREKERVLDEALRGVPGVQVPGDRERELARREAELGARERTLATGGGAAQPSLDQSSEAARIEARLQELRDAERAFLKTQEELATRSEALATRERLVAERERELDEQELGSGLGPTRSELADLESRLRRLETRGAVSAEDTQSFAAGLESLRRRGTKRPPTR
jgi:DNA repair exonuclease SbcCD ATPase subunit